MANNRKSEISNALITFLKNDVVDSSMYLDENTILNEGLIDSFVIIEMVLFLERTFGVKLDEKDLKPDNFKTVLALAECAALK